MKAGYGKRPRVEVAWEDAGFFSGGWAPWRPMLKRRARANLRCRSIGYVLTDDKDGLVLAASMSSAGEAFGVIVIPASQIVSRRTLP